MVEVSVADITINSQNTALLIQDMQNELLKGSMPAVPLSGPQIIANCQKLLEKVRQVSMPVIHVRVSRRADRKDAPRPPFGAPPGRATGPRLTEGTEDAQIVPELAPRPEDSVVTKHTTSPFNATDIEVYLRRFGINTLILTGYSTTGVVEGSLRDARDKDYDCIVVRDCCAAATEQEHNTSMDIVFPRMAWVASVNEVIDAIK
jgi:nicotinamidase-related amidase